MCGRFALIHSVEAVQELMSLLELEGFPARYNIGVDVTARDPKDDKGQRTTHCIVVFVAVDESRKPRAVPKFEAEE